MKNIFACLLMMTSLGLKAQDFYDLNTVQTIEIVFAQSNWDQLLDAAKSTTEDYIMAQSVTINGVVFDSVGVKYKGNSTYNANQTKNPFHIELDTYKEQDYQSYKDIKLSNVAKDPSFLREVLSYQILRQYMNAPQSNFANVYVNGTLMGLYSNSESITKTFVDRYFYSKNNAFFKCNPPAGAGPQSNDLPNLVYLGQDSASYYDAYELKSDEGWHELIDLCDTLNNHFDEIEKILDVDRALWMLAFDNVFVNLDSYIGGFAQNYYLYRDDNQRFIPIVWDLNESFGRFSNTGSGNLTSTTAKQQMSHLLHQNDSDFPLVQKLLNNPMYKRMYLAHVKTMLLENFDDGSYYATGIDLQNTINASVQADNNKFFTYANFLSNLTTDVSASGGGPGGGGSYPGITNLMDGRSAYLLGLNDFSQMEPSISNISASNPSPIINESIYLTADISDANAVYLGYRSDQEHPFNRIQMYDDGTHGDGAANDGVFGVEISIENTYTQYYIYAENTNIGMFSPRRAEHEFHSLTATYSNATVGDLVINEFLASNDATISDQDGEFDDWIELYNNSSTDIDLGGYALSDDPAELRKWEFPAGTQIEANSYLIVWADNDDEQDGLHAEFKLSASGESLFLVDDNDVIIDEVTFLEQSADVSYGRIPNGIGDFCLMPPTFASENSLSTALDSFQDVNFTLYPNPAEDIFYVQFEDEVSSSMAIFTLSGQLIHSQDISQNEYKLSVEINDWPDGIYYVRFKFDDQVISKKMVILN